MWRNKQIYIKEFNNPIKPTLVIKKNTDWDQYLTIGDVFVLSYYHEQSCCEKVYVDFEDIPNYIEQVSSLWIISKVTISSVKNDGIVVFLYPVEWDRLWIFLPCRNEQNWYYSDNLTIQIKYDNAVTTIDLNEVKAVQKC